MLFNYFWLLLFKFCKTLLGVCALLIKFGPVLPGLRWRVGSEKLFERKCIYGSGFGLIHVLRPSLAIDVIVRLHGFDHVQAVIVGGIIVYGAAHRERALLI